MYNGWLFQPGPLGLLSIYRLMSLIRDALKKTETQRSQPSLSRVSGWNEHQFQSPAYPPLERRASAPRSSSRTLLFTNVALLALLCVTAFYFWRNQTLIARDDVSVAAQEPTESVEIEATELPAAPESHAKAIESPQPEQTLATSPFLQPASETAAEPEETGDYDLGGTSTLGSNTLLSVVRRSDRRSIWIPVGKTVGEVTAESYDPEAEQAVIRVRGNLLSIAMRPFAGSDPDAEAEPAE
jgi:hypothetical protein